MKKINLSIFLIIFLCIGVFCFLSFVKISQSAEITYIDGFESDFGNWENVSGDDFNWTRRSGSTPSDSTGPSSAHTGSYYIYTEASSPNYPNKTAILDGPTFTFRSGSINFWYHMYGLSMGSLYLEIASSPYTSWTTIWSKSGNQGNSWYSADVDLTSYAGDSKRLRFRGVTDDHWRSDMALDDINLTIVESDLGTPSDCIGTDANTQHCCTCLSIDASPASIDLGDSSILTLNVDNNPDATSSVCSPNGFSAGDGAALCSIDNGVLSDTALNDGSYNYSVSPSNTITYTATCSGIGGTKNASVTITVNQSPTATNLTVTSLDYCIDSLPTRLSWSFSDPDPGDTQAAYQIQVDNNSDFSSPEIDSGSVTSTSESYTANNLSYNTTYYWRLKVWDNNGADSDWISGPLFTTPLHVYPDPDFSWSPFSPSVDEIVQLCAVQEADICPENVSTCYDINNNPISCSGKTFLWTLPPEAEFVGTSTTETTENPQIKFTDSDNYNVSLQITDDVGTCSITKQVGVAFPLPEWEESAP